MKVSIRRNGIVVRTIDITGESARIGKDPSNEIAVDDPYLSPHVADLVLKDGAWRIIDAGRLEGVRSAGGRVDDEPLVPGAVYFVGGFELIAHFGGSPPGAAQPPRGGSHDIPGTMIGMPFDDDIRRAASDRRNNFVPETVFGTMPVAPESGSFAAGFEAVPVHRGGVVSAPPPPRRRAVLLAMSGVMALAIILLLIVGIARRPDRTAKPAASATVSTAAAPVAVPDAAAELRAGERALAALDYDRGLAHWETSLTIKADPDLQRRYADVAVDVGRAFIARGESAKGAAYMQKAITHGPAGAESVAVAKGILARTSNP